MLGLPRPGTNVFFSLFAWAVGVATPADAHHSPAAYDMRAELLLEGTVVEFAWRNPHTFVTLETAAADGKKTLQEIEAGPSSILQPLGLRADSLRPGDHVVVRARPNRRGSGHTVLGVSVTTGDGTVLPLHLSGRVEAPPIAASGATTIAGKWLGRAEDFFALRDAMLQRWPLTDQVRASMATAGRGVSRARCVPYGPPEIHIEPVLTTIEVQADNVTFITDMDGVPLRRDVHLDLPEHPPDLTPTFGGHSIGRWEQGALVIDTIAFAPHEEGFGFGVPSSERKHLVERFVLSADGRELVYTTTIVDPEVLTEAVTVEARLDYRPDLTSNDSGCDIAAARRYLNER